MSYFPSNSLSRFENLKFLEMASKLQRESPLVILFHGFGADAYDLKGLRDVLDPESHLQWIFPQGILEVPIGPGWIGRAWWPVNMEALQTSIRDGTFQSTEDQQPTTLHQIRQNVMDLIESRDIPWDQVVLGGFSQGAMLATDIYLNAPHSPRGLVILSGTLINKTEWSQKVSNRGGQKFFISHGRSDTILPLKGAQRLETFLTQQGGLKGGLYTFSGGHEIPPEVLHQVDSYFHQIGVLKN